MSSLYRFCSALSDKNHVIIPLAEWKPHCDSGRISSDSGSSQLDSMWVSTLPVVDSKDILL